MVRILKKFHNFFFRVVFSAAREGHLPSFMAMIHRTKRIPIFVMLFQVWLMSYDQWFFFSTLKNYCQFNVRLSLRYLLSLEWSQKTREIVSRLIDTSRPYFHCFLLYPSDYYALTNRFCFTGFLTSLYLPSDYLPTLFHRLMKTTLDLLDYKTNRRVCTKWLL